MSPTFNRTPTPAAQRRLVLAAGITALLVLAAMVLVLYIAGRSSGSAEDPPATGSARTEHAQGHAMDLPRA